MGLITIEDLEISALSSIHYIADINKQYVKVTEKLEKGIVDVIITNNQKCMIIFDDDEAIFYNKDNAEYSARISIADFSSITIL